MRQERSYLFIILAVCAVVASLLVFVGYILAGWAGVVLAVLAYLAGIPLLFFCFIAFLAIAESIQDLLRKDR